MKMDARRWLVVALAASSLCNAGKHGCPSRDVMTPCVCTEKSQGLDILCDGAEVERLRETLRLVAEASKEILYLKLRNVKLSNLPEFLFDGLDITHLIIQNCTASTFHESAFSGQEKLTSLDLAYNNLKAVPTDSIENLASLTSLNLNYNNIEALQAECFRGMDSLVHLSLYGNKIHFVDNLAFYNFGQNLTRLNLGGNHLSAVPATALSKLAVLQMLQIQDNKISSLIPEDFAEMGESLDLLQLTNNYIEELPSKAFAYLSISSLDLDRNKIKAIKSDAFEGVEETLEWLKIGENKLEEIPSHALRNLTKLRQLDLRGNDISTISKDSFQYYGSSVKFILLQDNKISSIEHSAFQDLNSLEWLHLQCNQLTTASSKTFSHVLDTLQILDLHDNPFHCDCEIIWLKDWMKAKGKGAVSKPSETKCASPEQLHNIAVVDLPVSEMSCPSSSSTYLQSFFTAMSHQMFFMLIHMFATIS